MRSGAVLNIRSARAHALSDYFKIHEDHPSLLDLLHCWHEYITEFKLAEQAFLNGLRLALISFGRFRPI